MPGEVYQAVAKLKEPYLSYAILKAAYSGPKVERRICKSVMAGEVMALVTTQEEHKKARRASAEEELSWARRNWHSTGIRELIDNDNRLIAAFARWEIKVAYFALGRSDDLGEGWHELCKEPPVPPRSVYRVA